MEPLKHNYLIRTAEKEIKSEIGYLSKELCSAYISSRLQSQSVAFTHYTSWLRTKPVDSNKLKNIEGYITHLIEEVQKIKVHQEALDELKKLHEVPYNNDRN